MIWLQELYISRLAVANILAAASNTLTASPQANCLVQVRLHNGYASRTFVKWYPSKEQ